MQEPALDYAEVEQVLVILKRVQVVLRQRQPTFRSPTREIIDMLGNELLVAIQRLERVAAPFRVAGLESSNP